MQENGATCYKVDTSKHHTTNLNANGSEYYGAFKVCIPCDNVSESGSFSIKAIGGVGQFNLFLAYNPSATEQSYIVADPGYTTCDAVTTFKWTGSERPDSASLQVVKTGPGGAPLEGAEFTLTGDQGTTVTGTSDRNGQVIWTDLDPAEKYTLTETTAPEGYQIMSPVNVTLTAGRTEYLTVADDTEKNFTIKKIDAQNKASLQGAVFVFEQIDGAYKTTGTTGFDGTISFQGDELPYGSYRVTEQSAPDGYQKDTRVETVEWDGTRDVTITFENVRDIGLTIVKRDADTDVCLPGATFDVFADGEKITSVTTNDAGEAYVTGIKKEAYIEIVETAAPAGYVLDKTPHGIHIDPYNPAIQDDPVLTVTNQCKAALRIVKYDQQSGNRLSGVTFEIYKDSELFDTKTTDGNGEIFLYDLEPGTYLVQEVSTDDAHVVNSTPQQIELKAGQTGTQTLIFFNSLKPGIHLVKVDSVTMKSLPNVRFEFKKVGGSYRQEFRTDINGEIDLSKLEPGAYEVRELEAPDGYLIDDAVRVVQINPDENANFVFTNTPKPALRLIKTSSDGSRLGGVHFRIAKIEDGTHYLDRITQPDGEINIDNLEPGVYSVKETATVSDHIIDVREYHVELFPGKTSTLTIENQKRPNLIVYKHDADTGEPVPDTVFLVKAADGHSVNEIKTDSEGKATLNNLLPGVYEISEKSVPAPWLMDAPSQLVTLYPNRDHEVFFENHKKPTLTVNKVDSITGSPIKGAKFEVWYGSNNTTTGELNSLGTYFSDENGQFFIDLLRDGWYKVTELEPAPGFTIKEPAVQEVYIKGGESKVLTFLNEPLCSLTLTKKDSVTGKPVPGTEFTVKDGNGTVLGRYTTGKDGTVTVTGLVPGSTIVVVETKVPSGYVLDTTPQTIVVKNGSNSVNSGGAGTVGGTTNVTPGGSTNVGGGTNGGNDLTFENDPTTRLIIEKYVTGTTTPLKGVAFLVTESNGQLLGPNNGEYVTDGNGRIVIEGLEPGVTIIAKEIRTLDGYILDTTPKTIQIKVGDAQTLKFYNTPIGGLELIKASESSKSQRIPNTTFEIRRMDGGLVDTVTTDKQGRVHADLDAGDYYAVEIEAAEGFKIDSTPHYFTVQDGKTTTLTVTNAPFSGVIIHKVDSVTGEGIYDVKFLIYDSNKNPIGEYATDDQGYIYLDDLTVQGKGKLFIRELEAAEGYELDKQYKTVYVQPGKTVKIEWVNTPITGQIQVYKYAAEANPVTGDPAGKPLQGAVYEISQVRSGKVVDYITTDARGVAASKPLPLGRYKIVEVTAQCH